jgi:hypothetical protein
MSLRSALKLKDWDTSSPLSWDLPFPTRDGDRSWREAFPLLSDAEMKIREAAEGPLLDFEVFGRIYRPLGTTPPEQEDLRARVEARHFWAISFSHYSNYVTTLDLSAWRWCTWIRQRQSQILAAASFNYDLLLELVFGRFRPPVWVKPHGSVHYGQSPRVAWTHEFCQNYPLRIFYHLSDVPMALVPPEQLTQWRPEAFCILPNEDNHYRNFSWVASGYTKFQQVGPTLTHCIFLGLSYMECDRPEINLLLDSLGKDTTVISANPNPSHELLERVQGTGRKLVEWLNGPESI